MDEEVFTLVVKRNEMNAIIKALKHRRRILEETLARKNDHNPHIEGVKGSLAFNDELIGKLIGQRAENQARRLSDVK